MSLPKMTAPTFTTVVPSTEQEIEFRPFLVKEEKILLMALEGGDAKEMSNATNKILESCIITDIDVSKLATFDVEFLFLQLRGKSVGEVIDLRVGHSKETECNHKTDLQVNLDDIKVDGITPVKERHIMVTDEIGVKLRYPTLIDINSVGDSKDSVFNLIAKCVDCVFDNENVYEDFTEKEIHEWLEGLSQTQFDKVSAFYNSIPKLSHEIKWKCAECGEEDSFEIEGLQSFFT